MIRLPINSSSAKKDFQLKYQIDLQIQNIRTLNQELERSQEAHKALLDKEKEICRQFRQIEEE